MVDFEDRYAGRRDRVYGSVVVAKDVCSLLVVLFAAEGSDEVKHLVVVLNGLYVHVQREDVVVLGFAENHSFLVHLLHVVVR